MGPQTVKTTGARDLGNGIRLGENKQFWWAECLQREEHDMKAMRKMFVAGVALAVLAGGPVAFGLESAPFRVDARATYGGRVATGVEQVGEVDGASVRMWDTTSQADAWTALASQGSSADVCVLNAPAVEGGRIDADTSWTAERVHVVRDDVVVGEGATLTLERGTVVKFTEGAKIAVEEGGDVEAKGAHLADVADDSVGGDTNLDGGGSQPGAIAWWMEDPVVGALAGVDWVGGGEGLFRSTYSLGETYGPLPAPEREDAIFGGWFTKPGGAGVRVSADTRVNAQVPALYAKWTAYAVSVEPGTIAVPPSGGECEVAVTANAPWSAETAAAWIELANASGEGDGQLSLAVAANRGTTARAATVRVRMEKGGAFRDVTVTQEGMERVAFPVIRPADGTTFEGTSQRVVVSCATAGASVYYTLDGSEPDEAAIPYTGSFNVFDTTTVKAKAFQDGKLESGTASARLVRLHTLAEAIDQPLWTVATDEEHPWTVTDETTHDGVHAARSGAITDEEATRMETTVEGEGVLSFWWKVSCEDDPDGTAWDRLAFHLDGRQVTAIDGDGGWQEVSVKIKGDGVHALAWEYEKDWFDESETEDAGWVDQVVWAPTVTDGEVPVSWLADLGLVQAGMSGEDAAGLDVDGDGFTAAQEYLAGTDPTDADSVLQIESIAVRNGQAELTWSPDLEGDRDYRVLGKRSMTDGDPWEDVTEKDRSEYRFFMVEVKARE